MKSNCIIQNDPKCNCIESDTFKIPIYFSKSQNSPFFGIMIIIVIYVIYVILSIIIYYYYVKLKKRIDNKNSYEWHNNRHIHEIK